MNTPQIFKDANGIEIKAGDKLYRTLFYRHPVTHAAMPVRIVREVQWSGACLTANLVYCSDGHARQNLLLYDANDTRVCELAASAYMNKAFDSSVYEVLP